MLDQTYRALVRSNEDTQIADAAERSRAANIRVVQPPERPSVGRNLANVLAVAGVAVGLVAAVAALAVSNALKTTFVTDPRCHGRAGTAGAGRGGAGAQRQAAPRGPQSRPSSRWAKQQLPGKLGA